MTLSNAATQRAAAEAAAPETPETSPQAQVRAPARENSVPSAISRVPAALHAPSPEDTRARVVAVLLIPVRTFTSGDHLLRGQPRDPMRLWAEHKAAAGHWNAAIIRGPRLLYGLAHTTVLAFLHWLGDLTFSPIGLALTIAGIWLLAHFV